jgi:hypothetical protein
MATRKPLSLDELQAMNANMHTQSQEQLLATMETMLSSMDPELEERFRNLMAQAKARPPKPRLAEITSASLRSLSGEDLDGAIYDYVATRLADAADSRAALVALPRGLQVFYLSFIVEAEVLNGGLDQFFYNPWSDMADLVAPALRELRADEAADLFEHACGIAADLPPLLEFNEDGTAKDVVESQAERALAQLDKRFCPLAGQFPMLRAEFIKKREEVFLSAPGGRR